MRDLSMGQVCKLLQIGRRTGQRWFDSGRLQGYRTPGPRGRRYVPLEKLRAFIPPAGNMISNPIDAHIVLLDLNLLGQTLDILSAESFLDMFVISLHLDWLTSREDGTLIEKIGTYIVTEAWKHTNGKPLVVAWRQYQPNPETKKRRDHLVDILMQGGVPVYEGIPSAVFALAKLAQYHAFQRNSKSRNI